MQGQARTCWRDGTRCSGIRLLPALALTALAFVAPARAEICTGDPVPKLYVYYDKSSNIDASDDFKLNGAVIFATRLQGKVEELGGRIAKVDEESVRLLVNAEARSQATGGDGGNSDAIARGIGAEWVYSLRFLKVESVRRMDGKLINTLTGTIVQAFNVALPADTLPDGSTTLNISQANAVIVAQAEAQAVNITCLLYRGRVKPVVPAVSLELTPGLSPAGGAITARASLTDLADQLAQPGQPLLFTHVPPQGPSQSFADVRTDFFGYAQQTVTAGNFVAGVNGKVTANYSRPGVAAKAELDYRVIKPAGDLTMLSPRAKLRPDDPEVIDLSLKSNGAAVGAATVTLGASAGALGVSAAVTSPQGTASVTYRAPSEPSFTVVTGRGPSPAAGGTQAEDSLSFVVDAGVRMSISARDTLVSSPATVTVDLDQDSQPLTNAVVSFRLAGGGFLEASTAVTDRVGRAEVVFAAPPQAGASTVTATVTLDGQTYTRTVSIRYIDDRDGIAREIDEVIRLVRLDPSNTNLQRLLNLRTLLRSRGENSRAEQVLDAVDGPLYCVHQLADDTCRSGSGLAPVQGTLDLLRGISADSTLLASLGSRVRDTRRACPYPAFMQGAAYDFAATVNPGSDPSYTVTLTGLVAMNSWNDDDTPSFLSFQFFEPNTGRPYIYGGVAVSGRGPTFTGLIDSGGDIFGFYGSRMQMIGYQSRATRPTVSVTVGRDTVSGTFDLYDYVDSTNSNNDVRIATASINATVQLPPAPTYSCGQTPPPPGGED